MTAKELNDSNFDAIIAAADKPVLVDFHAEWCGSGKMLRGRQEISHTKMRRNFDQHQGSFQRL